MKYQVADAVTVLRGGGGATLSSVVVTSNLRRAIATGLITLWERLRGGDERYLVHSDLQARGCSGVRAEGGGRLIRLSGRRNYLHEKFCITHNCFCRYCTVRQAWKAWMIDPFC